MFVNYCEIAIMGVPSRVVNCDCASDWISATALRCRSNFVNFGLAAGRDKIHRKC